MSRRFWAGLMIVALAVAGGSFYLISGRLASQPAPAPVPAPGKKIPAPKPASPVAVSSAAATTAAAVAVSSEPAKPAAPVASAKPATSEWKSMAATAKPEPKADKPRRNILFKLARPTAKKVEIVADFNGWTPHPMKKVGKVWQVSVSLPAGRFEYAFLVDGKRMRDPNNRQTNGSGKSSVLTVKPLVAPKH